MYIIKKMSKKGNIFYSLAIRGYKNDEGKETTQYVVLNNYDYMLLKNAGIKEYSKEDSKNYETKHN